MTCHTLKHKPNLGDLRGKFIFDRNLGARNETRNVEGKGVLLYPYGRKDPFAGGISGYVTIAYLGRTSNLWTVKGVSGESTGGVPIATSVNNPMVCYIRSSALDNWCSAVNSNSIIWHDMDYDISSNAKSIFDPSPYGWKVPANGTWASFSLDTTTWHDGTEDGQRGRWYPAEDPIAYYPATGYRGANTATLIGFTTHGICWSSTPYDELISYNFSFSFTSGTVSPSGTAGRSSARSVRPVQHFESAFGN